MVIFERVFILMMLYESLKMEKNEDFDDENMMNLQNAIKYTHSNCLVLMDLLSQKFNTYTDK